MNNSLKLKRVKMHEILSKEIVITRLHVFLKPLYNSSFHENKIKIGTMNFIFFHYQISSVNDLTRSMKLVKLLRISKV